MSDETLTDRIAAVQGELQRVAKTGHATVTTRGGSSYSYDYATQADLFAAVRPLLAKRGIAAMISCDAVHLDVQDGTAHATVEMSLHLRAAGDEIVLRGIGTATDRGDRAPYKAQTSISRYLVAQAFLIETGDDAADSGDSDPPPRNRAAGAAASPATGRTSAATPADPHPQPDPEAKPRTRTTSELQQQEGDDRPISGQQIDRLFAIANKLPNICITTASGTRVDDRLLHQIVMAWTGHDSIKQVERRQYDGLVDTLQAYNENPQGGWRIILDFYKQYPSAPHAPTTDDIPF